MKDQIPPKPDRRWVGAAFVTVVLAILAGLDQVQTGTIDKWLIFGLVAMGLRWGGESIADMLRSWRG